MKEPAGHKRLSSLRRFPREAYYDLLSASQPSFSHVLQLSAYERTINIEID